ncbi:MAG TPA: thioredoxin domain-containing protein [Polyangiales bacterium]|nr:thioredoxin domain-containing protein [Polyangiales bacterium]
MTKALEEINDLNFDTEVLGSKEPFLLDFSAVWCAPCKAMQPLIEGVAKDYAGKLRVGKIDIDHSPGIATRFSVRGAPTVILFRDGKEAARKLGFTNRQGLIQLAGV